MSSELDAPAELVTFRVGGLGSWHGVHIVLSLFTGVWVVVYAVHAIISAVTQTNVTLRVPPGARVEYWRGHPQVLMPGQHLPPDLRRIWLWRIAVGVILLLAATTMVILIFGRD